MFAVFYQLVFFTLPKICKSMQCCKKMLALTSTPCGIVANSFLQNDQNVTFLNLLLQPLLNLMTIC